MASLGGGFPFLIKGGGFQKKIGRLSGTRTQDQEIKSLLL